MNKTMKRLISVILIILFIFNFFYSYCVPVYATDIVNGAVVSVVNFLVNALGGVAGFFTLPYRLIGVGIGLGANILTAQIAYMDGTTEGADTDLFETIVITPFEIFFNKVQILDVNFLDVDVGGTTEIFRTAVAEWYYIMRLIASAILLLILIYVGIRMAISTVASEKAMYKKSLVDWATSLALIFLLQYIIMFTVNANAAIIAALENVADSVNIEEKIMGIALMGLGISFESMASSVIYVLFVIQVLMFVLRYIKRMLTVAFLIIISPLISITYSIDKMGDGKAQALNTWLKEFVYNVLIQPFHCIIYLAFLGTAFDLLMDGGSGLDILAAIIPIGFASDLGNAVLAIMCMFFIDDAEKIVKKIFGFDAASSLGSSLTTLAMAGMVAKGAPKAVGAATGLRKAINTSKDKGLLASVRKDYLNIKNRDKIKSRAEEIKLDPTNDIKDQKEAEKLAKEEVWKADKAERKKSKKDKALDKRMEGFEPSDKDAEALMSEDEKKLKETDSKAYEKKLDEKKSELKTKKRKEESKKYDEEQEEYYKNHPVAAARRNMARKISNPTSNVGKFYKRTAMPGALAFVSAVAGSAQSPFAGVAAGTAMYKGASEFFKTSKSNLVKDASDHVHEDTDVRDIQQRGSNGDFEKDSEEMKRNLEEIKTALEALRDNKKLPENANIADMAKQIQSNIQYDKQADPASFDLEGILEKVTGKKNIGSDEALMKASSQWARFQDDAALYSAMQKGADVGMSATDFEEALKDKVTSQQNVTTSNVIHYINSTKDVTEIVNRVDEADVQSVIKQIETAMSSHNETLTNRQRERMQQVKEQLERK